MNTKGTIMSGGSRCVVAEMLSILGFRESGILDWGNNTVGIRAFIDAVTGTTYHNLFCGSYQYHTDNIDDEIKSYALLDGVEYYHETNDFHYLDNLRIFPKNKPSKILKRAERIVNWFSDGKPFVYLVGKDEKASGYWWDVFDKLVAEQYPTENILLISDNEFHEWYGRDWEGQGRLLIKFYKDLLEYFPKEVLTKRSDYNIDKYGGHYGNALKEIELLSSR